MILVGTGGPVEKKVKMSVKGGAVVDPDSGMTIETLIVLIKGPFTRVILHVAIVILVYVINS